MKIFVIEKGIYSDRHVIGVAESEEDAKAFVGAINNKYNTDCSYEEWDTNQIKTNKLKFHVEYLCGDWYVSFDDYDAFGSYNESTEIYEDNWIIFAKSSEQAIKIAQDMRAERLAIEKEIS